MEKKPVRKIGKIFLNSICHLYNLNKLFFVAKHAQEKLKSKKTLNYFLNVEIFELKSGNWK